MAKLLIFFIKLYDLLFFSFFSKKVNHPNQSKQLIHNQKNTSTVEPKLNVSLLGFETKDTDNINSRNKKIFSIIEVSKIEITDTLITVLKAQLCECFLESNHVSIKKLNQECFTLTLNKSALDKNELFIQKLHEVIVKSICLFDKSEVKRDLASSLKMGICDFNAGANQMMVYQLAQSALMISKNSEWLSYYCYSYNHTQTQLLALTSSDISDYIEKKRYILLFQPVFSIFNGDILQHEALIRIRHETLGLLNASQLLPNVKSQQQMQLLDKAIVTQVMNVINSEAGYQHVSINLYQTSWLDIAFFSWLIKVLICSKNHKNIILELSEIDLLNKENQLQHALHLVKSHNISLVLDKVEGAILDKKITQALFVKYNIKSFKLSYNLVHNINFDINKQKKVKEITSFAKDCFLPVFAVGIEQKLELDVLKKLGVVGAQGHYFSEPLQELSAFSKA